MDDNEWVNSEKEACSASFSYWAATGKSTGWNWPLGWKRSNEENRHLPTSFLGLFYPTLKKKLKSETMILGGGPCSQSVRQIFLARMEVVTIFNSCLIYNIRTRHRWRCPQSRLGGTSRKGSWKNSLLKWLLWKLMMFRSIWKWRRHTHCNKWSSRGWRGESKAEPPAANFFLRNSE